MRPYLALCIYRVSRRSRYHGLIQIQPYTWGAALILTRGIGCCLRYRMLPCSATHVMYLFAAKHSFSVSICAGVLLDETCKSII